MGKPACHHWLPLNSSAAVWNFSSDLRPILFFECSYPDLPKAADYLLFSFQTSKSIFPLFFSSKVKPSPHPKFCFLVYAMVNLYQLFLPLPTISLSTGDSSFSNKRARVFPISKRKSQSNMTFTVFSSYMNACLLPFCHQ